MDLKASSFTKQLQTAVQNSRWQDTITPRNKPPNRPPELEQRTLELSFIELPHELWTTLEFEEYMYCFFTHLQPNDKKEPNKPSGKPTFSLAIRSFNRDDGKSSSLDLKDFKGTPSCLAGGTMAVQSEGKMLAQNQPGQLPYYFKVVLLVGLKQGFIKVIQLNTGDSSKGVKPFSSSHKIQHKPLISIKIFDPLHFDLKNICLILFEDCKVILFNYLSKLTICIYQPPALGHDHGISLALHSSGLHFATASRSGQILIWEINERAREAIARSEDKEVRKEKDSKESSMEIFEEVWAFKPKHRIISVFPSTAIHSASIHGLKWIGFMGNLLALVTKTGLFRLISISFELRDQYILLFEHQIPNGQAISSVQLLPQAQTLIVFKGHTYTHEYIDLQKQLSQKPSSQISLLQRQQLLKQDDNFTRGNFNGIQRRVNDQNWIEKYVFGGDLTMHSVEQLAVCMLDRRWQRIEQSRAVMFEEGMVSMNQEIVMVRNEKGFTLGKFLKEDQSAK